MCLLGFTIEYLAYQPLFFHFSFTSTFKIDCFLEICSQSATQSSCTLNFLGSLILNALLTITYLKLRVALQYLETTAQSTLGYPPDSINLAPVKSEQQRPEYQGPLKKSFY